MAVNLSGIGIPTGTDVEVEIKIHTHLNISSYVAKQKANVCLTLHCGQSFWVEDPVPPDRATHLLARTGVALHSSGRASGQDRGVSG